MKVLLGIALVSSLLGAGGDYELVTGWPQLPQGLELGDVTGVAVGRDQRVWVFHRHPEKPILCFDASSGKLLRAFGGGLIENAHGLAVGPEGNLWVTDLKLHQVIVLSPEGEVVARWGEARKAGWDSTHFNLPTTVAFGPAGEVYVGDGYGNSRVARFSAQGKYLGEWGKAGSGPGEFQIPHGIAVDRSGLVYVADRGNARVQVFDAHGSYLREWKSPALGRPWAIAVAPDGTFFVADGGDEGENAGAPRSRVLQVDAQGKILAQWGGYGREAGNFVCAHDLAVGADGAIYVGDVKGGRRVQKFVPRKR